MSAMLPVAYAAVMFLSGTAFGFFIWAWFRGNDEIETSDYRRHTERLRDTVQQEQQRTAWLQRQLAERTGELGRVENQRKRYEHQFSMIRDLAKERKQRLLAATDRSDKTLELLQAERRRTEQLEADQKRVQCELDLADDRISRLLAEKEASMMQQAESRQAEPQLVERQLAAVAEPEQNESEQNKTEPRIFKLADNVSSSAAASDRQYDSRKGMIYVRRPAEVDDLKRIAGVAEKLEEKLNAQGIYTFEQIMMWDDVAVAEFSTLLETFKDRIERNNWVEQARYFHEQKLSSARVTIPMQTPDTEVA